MREPIGRLRVSIRRRYRQGGDSSFLAVPRLPGYTGVVLLQLRDPLKVIASLVGMRFFSNLARSPQSRGFAALYFDATGDDLTDSMRWWVEWNRRAEAYAHRVYRLEDVDQELPYLLALLGADHPDARADKALRSVARDINRGRNFARLSLGWDDLPDGEPKQRLREYATLHDYQ
jgi:hypothetical protein